MGFVEQIYGLQHKGIYKEGHSDYTNKNHVCIGSGGWGDVFPQNDLTKGAKWRVKEKGSARV